MSDGASPTLWLDNVPLEGNVDWSERVGINPVTWTCVLRRDAGEALLAARQIGKSVLEVVSPMGNRRKLERLTILREGTAPRPDMVALIVADWRWEWPRIPVHESFNVRRKTGDRRVLDTGAPVAVQTIVDDVAYAVYSLKNRKTAWNDSSEAIQRLLENVGGSLDTRSAAKVPVENWDFLLTNFAAAWRRLEQAVPGLRIKLKDDGTPVAFFAQNRGEEAIAASAKPRHWGSGWPRRCDLSFMRPKEIHVLFEREIEVRFDFEETSGTPSTTQADAVAPVGYNVVRVPDRSLALPGYTLPDGTVLKARTAVQGQWAPMQEYLAEKATETHPLGSSIPPLSDGAVRKAWFHDVMFRLWAATDVSSNPTWGRVVAAIKASYRSSYMLPRKWVDCAKAILPTLVSIRDDESGTRAKARVYGDYAVAYGTKRTRLEKQQETKLLKNYQGSPASRSMPLTDSTVQQASATLTVEDQGLGVIQLHYHLDPTSNGVQIVPSLVEDADFGVGSAAMPEADMSKPLKAQLLEHTVLAASHRVAILLTLIPASPNSPKALHKEIVHPDETAALLGERPGECKGPIWTINVPSSFCRSLWGWQDDSAAAVQAAFGLDGGDGTGGEFPGVQVNAIEVRDVARAFAAQLWGRLLDHVEGVTTTPFAPYQLDGSLAELRHSVNNDGVFTTTLDFPAERPQLDVLALIPPGTLRKLNRLVQ